MCAAERVAPSTALLNSISVCLKKRTVTFLCKLHFHMGVWFAQSESSHDSADGSDEPVPEGIAVCRFSRDNLRAYVLLTDRYTSALSHRVRGQHTEDTQFITQHTLMWVMS